ncbi:MAG TPA: Hsp70 family protein, partial [Mycobacterium sp.]|nr:Hsp70 family protein [Mycobacterium sp.]
AVRRTPVVTLYPHRPPEVGVPSENPNLTERGLIITDFVDRVGDPVGIVAADGSTHRADKVLADALRAMLHTVGGPQAGPAAVAYPAHWRPAAVDTLRNALAALPELREALVVSDAMAALTALQDDPGVPTRGVIALCDFGGTGTNITLVDAANNCASIGPTVRHTDLSGDLIDQALLTHVINDLSAAGTIDSSRTSAIGALSRLRTQCRTAKERLSIAAVTSLVAELNDHRSDVRLTRNELDEVIRVPLAGFVAVVQETLERNGIHTTDLAAVASVGGGARIPIVTTTLSEQFRVPVITIGQPELAAGIGGGLRAARGTVDEDRTSMAVAPGVAAAAAAATAMAPQVGQQDVPQSGTFGALAWSEADDSPDVAPADLYDYGSPAAGYGFTGDARPDLQFDHEPYEDEAEPVPWYRKPALVLVAGVLAMLAALTAAVLYVMRDQSSPAPASTTPPVTTTIAPPPPTTTAAAPTPVAPEPPPQIQAPQTRTVTQQAPQPPATVTEAPPPPPETSEAPPPPPPATSEAPPPTTEAPQTPRRPRWRPTAPYPTVPGLPWVPAPQLPGQPAPP